MGVRALPALYGSYAHGKQREPFLTSQMKCRLFPARSTCFSEHTRLGSIHNFPFLLSGLWSEKEIEQPDASSNNMLELV